MEDICLNKNAVFLNSGRNCLKYLIRSLEIKELKIPYYICQSVRYAVKQENVKMKFYHIDKNFMPLAQFSEDEFILYPNYFGICMRQNKILSEKYANLISDNAHAFFAPPTGCASFYSPRKIFKVNDGGILITDKKLKTSFPADKDRNLEITDYETFCKNELSIDNEPIKFMSLKTKTKLMSFDKETEKTRRINIFKNFDKIFAEFNNLRINLTDDDVPFVYPFLSPKSYVIGEFLDKKGIYTLKYATNFPEKFSEYELSKNILLIPLREEVYKICEMMIKNSLF